MLTYFHGSISPPTVEVWSRTNTRRQAWSMKNSLLPHSSWWTKRKSLHSEISLRYNIKLQLAPLPDEAKPSPQAFNRMSPPFICSFGAFLVSRFWNETAGTFSALHSFPPFFRYLPHSNRSASLMNTLFISSYSFRHFASAKSCLFSVHQITAKILPFQGHLP